MFRLYSTVRHLVIDGRTVYLSPNETRILKALQDNAGRYVKSTDLAHAVYGTAEKAYSNALRAAVYCLRNKIRLISPRTFIKSRHNKGYMLEVDHAE